MEVSGHQRGRGRGIYDGYITKMQGDITKQTMEVSGHRGKGRGGVDNKLLRGCTPSQATVHTSPYNNFSRR